jgi:glycerol-3-phosphate dehydrogenase
MQVVRTLFPSPDPVSSTLLGTYASFNNFLTRAIYQLTSRLQCSRIDCDPITIEVPNVVANILKHMLSRALANKKICLAFAKGLNQDGVSLYRSLQQRVTPKGKDYDAWRTMLLEV